MMGRDLELSARALVRELPGLAPVLVVIVLLLCLIVPVPTPLLDLSLSLSLAGSLVMLVAALRVRRAAELLEFPTLVLLAALARLALNVSTTRAILTDADAGRVVEAFAGMVVRDDLFVGIVVFAIVTAIQYLVIARGSERVAEVAARFVLDGMPGQQAAIEADLRAGAIANREAEQRRANLHVRADLYGRMDGVMRFIKGDALIGLLITAVNLAGGLLVGMRAGLPLRECLDVYGRLTIGDGLLAQIPALLVSLAAGLLVARVDVDAREPGRSLPWLAPSWLIAPALLLGTLALVPGMPWLAFMTAAIGLTCAALWLARSRSEGAQADAAPVLRVRVHAPEPALARELAGVRERVEDWLDMTIPPLVLEPCEELAPDRIELRLGERVLASEHAEGPGHDARLHACFCAVMRAAPDLIELEPIQAAIDEVRRKRPELVRWALREVAPLDVLWIARAFVRERLPLPRMDALLRVLAERRVFSQSAERPHWSEHAREALADHWVHDVCHAAAKQGAPVWLRASPDLEDALIEASSPGESGALVHWPAARRKALLDQIGNRVGRAPALLVCTSRARPAFASVLARARPHVPVLAFAELAAAGVEEPRMALLDEP